MKLKSIIVSMGILPVFLFANCNLTAGGLAGPNGVFMGPTTCTGGNVDSISVQGSLNIVNTTIHVLHVNGPLTASQANLDSAFVNGTVQADHSNIAALTANGNLNISNSNLGNVTVAGTMHFSQMQIQNISAAEGSVIYLDAGALVTGNITFTGTTPGVIYLNHDAIIRGSVTGATIENQ